MTPPTVLIVPGLRDHAEQHWQTLLERELPRVRAVPPMGRDDLDCAKRVAAIEQAAAAIDGPIVIVAHSGGVVMVAHWAAQTRVQVQGALLAAPPDFESPLPEGYPSAQALAANGWTPMPRAPLPFPSVVAASTNDPLGALDRVVVLARQWGSQLVNAGAVGHLNPASGHGEWPMAITLLETMGVPVRSVALA